MYDVYIHESLRYANCFLMVENSQRKGFGAREDSTCIFLAKSVSWRNIRMIRLYIFIVFKIDFADSICQLSADLELTSEMLTRGLAMASHPRKNGENRVVKAAAW